MLSKKLWLNLFVNRQYHQTLSVQIRKVEEQRYAMKRYLRKYACFNDNEYKVFNMLMSEIKYIKRKITEFL